MVINYSGREADLIILTRLLKRGKVEKIKEHVAFMGENIREELEWIPVRDRIRAGFPRQT